MSTKIRSSGKSKSTRVGKSPKSKKRIGTAKKRTTSSSGKRRTRKTAKRSSAPTDKLTMNALKFIDQAADLLREGVIASASQSSRVQHTTRKKAHILIEKAHNSLGEALDMGTSALHKMLGKI